MAQYLESIRDLPDASKKLDVFILRLTNSGDNLSCCDVPSEQMQKELCILQKEFQDDPWYLDLFNSMVQIGHQRHQENQEYVALDTELGAKLELGVQLSESLYTICIASINIDQEQADDQHDEYVV